MHKHQIIEDIKAGKKILSIQMIDGTNGGLVSYLTTFRTPESIFESKSLKIMPGTAIKQRMQMKDPHIHTTKKQVNMEVKSSLILAETYLPAGNVVEVVVITDKKILGEIEKNLEKLVEKLSETENS